MATSMYAGHKPAHGLERRLPSKVRAATARADKRHSFAGQKRAPAAENYFAC
jgi:hypothetical protein